MEETLNAKLQRFDDEISVLRKELAQAKATISMLSNKPDLVIPEQLTEAKVVDIINKQPKQSMPKQLTRSQVIDIFDDQPKPKAPRINTLTAGDVVRIFNEQQKKLPAKKVITQDVSEKIKDVVNLDFINNLYGRN